jgi:hypothetical protein
MHSGREEFCLVTGCANRRILSSLARARPNGRVERFCCVQKLHFDEHYIIATACIAKNSSFRDSEVARLVQIDQITVVDSMESSKVGVHKLTNSPWILVTRLWNQHVICSLCLFLSLRLFVIVYWVNLHSFCSTCMARSQSSDRHHDWVNAIELPVSALVRPMTVQ